MSTNRMQITRMQKTLAATTAVGAVVIAAIGFAGSFTAVQQLAVRKGFGDFAFWFPIGIDAGIVVLLALDLLLTWIRMPFPLLRPMAWLLTAATIAFNGAAAWPDPLGTGMHAVIPLLFVVSVEAARHAVGRIADITADRHIESIPLRRWLLAPWPSFRLMRRMHLWQIRTLDDAVAREQAALMFAAEMRQEFGRRWRTSGPARAAMAHRFATRYGAVLDVTADEFVTSRPATASATPNPATVSRDATNTAMPTATEQSAATAPATTSATQSVAKRAAAPKPTVMKSPTKDTKSGSKTQAQEIITPLYETLGRRPSETEMVEALKAASFPHTSPAYAKLRRGEIEREHPNLAALGQENVRPLTGTDS